MNLKHWFGLIYLAFLIGCEKPIDIPEVEHESQLIVLAELHQGGIEASVSKSVSRNAAPPAPITDAEVTAVSYTHLTLPTTPYV